MFDELYKNITNESSLNFNPDEINIGQENYSCSILLDMLKFNEINLNTDFQRKSYLWKNDVMSKFLESMFLRFPIPPFYFNAKKESGKLSWEIIDGLQRLSTLQYFVYGNQNGEKLKLEGLEFFPELDGLYYEELPRHILRDFHACQLQAHIVHPNTPTQVVYRIFERINTQNFKLEDQEVRHAIYQGDIIDTLKNDAKLLEEYGISSKINRMGNQEIALRFYSFYCFDLELYPKGRTDGMRTFLDNSIRALSKLDRKTIDRLDDKFKQSIALSFHILGEDCFRGISKRFNRSLFDCICVAIAKIDKNKMKYVIKNRDILKAKYYSIFDDEKFIKSISNATGRYDNVAYRFRKINDIFTMV